MTDATDWYSPETATFGDRIAGAREALGLSQRDLAHRLGVRPETLRGWEDDRTEPRSNRLQMLAGLLNVSIRWLLTGEGEGLEGPAAPQPLRPGAREALAEAREGGESPMASDVDQLRAARRKIEDLRAHVERIRRRLDAAWTPHLDPSR